MKLPLKSHGKSDILSPMNLGNNPLNSMLLRGKTPPNYPAPIKVTENLTVFPKIGNNPLESLCLQQANTGGQRRFREKG